MSNTSDRQIAIAEHPAVRQYADELAKAPFVTCQKLPLPQSPLPIVLFQDASEEPVDPEALLPEDRARIAAVFWRCNPEHIHVSDEFVHEWAEMGVPVIYMFPALDRMPSDAAVNDLSESLEIAPEELFYRRELDGRFVASAMVMDTIDNLYAVRNDAPESYTYRKVTVTRWSSPGNEWLITCPVVQELMQAFAITSKLTPKKMPLGMEGSCV